MRLAITAAVLLALGALGCGRSSQDAVNDYCHARIYCAVDNKSVPECVTENLTPGGDPHHQCSVTAKAVCMGNCYDDHGCGIFDVNNPCNCDHADDGCPP
jgi:hypothetical protein